MKASMALVRTTLPTRKAADGLAEQLVNGGLAACVHVQSTASTYRWNAKVETEQEWLVEARALGSRVAAVREAMLASHPHEVPLVEVLTVTGIPGAYLKWARSA